MTLRYACLGPIACFLLPLLACVPAVAQKANALPTVEATSFEGSNALATIKADHAKVSLHTGEGVTDGGQALRIDFSTDHPSSGIEITTSEPWDCRTLGDCRLTFDVTNIGPTSVQLRGIVRNSYGATVKRSIAIPRGETQTVYFGLVGDGATADQGMRDDPPAFEGVGRKMLIDGLKQDVDLSVIESLKLFVLDAADKDTLVIDHVRFAANPEPKSGYLEGIVDQFGQNSGVSFPEKVESEEQLKQLAKDELTYLEASSPVADRSRFGGWKQGPRLEGTGYFRTEKVGDRWTMVDPEGYLYFATGIANLRMANTSTFTGVDFKDPQVRYRDPKDLTPEDSIGIKPTNSESRKTRFVAYPERHKMFAWLPEYDDSLANHYGYRRSAHSGPIKHGEVFSFYRANLERRYGNPTAGHAMSVWRQATMDRMLDWGFTSLGNWTDATFYPNEKIPFFANGWIIGDFKTVSSGYDYWGPMPDPFDPKFAERAKLTTAAIAEEVQGTPWCVGVFIDNEKSWGNMNSNKTHYGIVINTLGRDASDSPCKDRFVEILKEKHGEIGALNQQWQTSFASWEALAEGVEEQDSYENPSMLADFSILLDAYADEYFRTVHDALEEVMPNHMYLGCRLTHWGMTPEVAEAASRYVGVMSYNYYHEALGERKWDFLADVDMPSIIGEWHMGATDTGLPHSGIIHAASQEDRGRMYQAYMQSVVENLYFVGAHWFQYIDSPLTGRAHDGENYNVGFVTIADIPYKPLVKAAKDFNSNLYQKAYGPYVESNKKP